jgi:hypothetical protein
MKHRLLPLVAKLSVVCLGLMLVTGGIALATGSLSTDDLDDGSTTVAGQELEDTTTLEAELEDELAKDGDTQAAGPGENAADVARAIHAYRSTTTDTGCTFGQNVAAIASGGDPNPDHDPCAQGSEEDVAAKSDDDDAEVEEEADDDSDDTDASGSAADEDSATGDDVEDEDGADDSGSQGSRETGEKASEEGRSHKP